MTTFYGSRPLHICVPVPYLVDVVPCVSCSPSVSCSVGVCVLLVIVPLFSTFLSVSSAFRGFVIVAVVGFLDSELVVTDMDLCMV